MFMLNLKYSNSCVINVVEDTGSMKKTYLSL